MKGSKGEGILTDVPGKHTSLRSNLTTQKTECLKIKIQKNGPIRCSYEKNGTLETVSIKLAVSVADKTLLSLKIVVSTPKMPQTFKVPKTELVSSNS